MLTEKPGTTRVINTWSVYKNGMNDRKRRLDPYDFTRPLSMIKPHIALMCSGIVLISCPAVHADRSMSCNGALVELRDTRREVEAACGPPSFMDTREEEMTLRVYRRTRHVARSPNASGKTRDRAVKEEPGKAPDRKEAGRKETHRGGRLKQDNSLVSEQTFLKTIEEWTYNFGPRRFIRVLVFENDQLVSIDTGGYGFESKPKNDPIVKKGDSKAVVMMKYGPPAYEEKRQRREYGTTYREDEQYLFAEERARTVVEEDWTYDLGPGRFMQKLSFKNNRLVKITVLKDRGKKE